MNLLPRARRITKPSVARSSRFSNLLRTNKRYFSNHTNARMQTFTIYRWDPHKDSPPEERSYEVDVSDCPMILDVLFKVKNQQDSVMFEILFNYYIVQSNIIIFNIIKKK